MQDLIERRAALTALCEDCKTKYNGLCPHPASRCVEFRTIKQLAAIKPQRHGRWEIINTDANVWQCTTCGEEWMLNDGNPSDNNMLFCPRCGSRMDGGADND